MASHSYASGSSEFSGGIDSSSLEARQSAPAGLFKMEFLQFNDLSTADKQSAFSSPDLPTLELASANLPLSAESAFNGRQVQALRRELIESEGVRNAVYFDSRGIRTIGIGFNHERSDAPVRLKEVGADFHKVFNGSQKLNGQQIEKLFKFTLNEAIEGGCSSVSGSS